MYELLTLVANITGSIRRETRNGRSYIVAPVTILVPGVVPGDKGPLLYRPDVVARNPEDWNDTPMVVYHPKRDGKFVSARHPDVLEKSEIGRVYNMVKGAPARGEGWFDEERTQKVDSRVYNALLRNEKIEVSSGILQVSRPSKEGDTYEGKPYVGEVLAYKPDHLAILPDELGACPITAGCGVNNAQPSHDDLRHQLQTLLDVRFGTGGMGGYGPPGMGCYILDVFDKEVVYNAYEKLWKIKYVTDLRTSTVSLAQEAPVEVRKIITYKPINNSQGPTSEVEPTISYEEINTVNRTELITFLTANCACWKGNGDKETLEKFSDQKLQQLKEAYDKQQNAEAVANAARAGFSSDSHDLTWDDTQKKFVIKQKTPVAPPQPAPIMTANTVAPTLPVAPVARVLTEQEWLASAPPAVQSVVANAMRKEQEEKQQLILSLTANVTTEPEKANLTTWLGQQNVENLRNMAKLHPQRQQSVQQQPFTNSSPILTQPSYQLASAPAPVANAALQQANNQATDDLLPLPTIYGG